MKRLRSSLIVSEAAESAVEGKIRLFRDEVRRICVACLNVQHRTSNTEHRSRKKSCNRSRVATPCYADAPLRVPQIARLRVNRTVTGRLHVRTIVVGSCALRTSNPPILSLRNRRITFRRKQKDMPQAARRARPGPGRAARVTQTCLRPQSRPPRTGQPAGLPSGMRTRERENVEIPLQWS